MRFHFPIKTGLFAGLVGAVVGLTGVSANAACDAFVNGRPMTWQECSMATRVYGYVEPGFYVTDRYGNWAKVGDWRRRGNIRRDSRAPRSNGGGRRSDRHTSTVIDPTNGCEGGSCVNILD